MATPFTKPLTAKGQQLARLLEQRIVFLDGAMGTMIQQHTLEEADFRDESLAAAPGNLKGNNDLLSITRPEIIEDIHRAFLEAGADSIETNTFSGTTIAQADYGLESRVRDINLHSAQIARKVADEIAEKEGRPTFVAGAIGPTNRTASMSPDVNRPEYRATSYEELRKAYYEQIEALVEGGVDLLSPETVFDTLNLKACLHAIEDFFDTCEARLPVIISVTITDQSVAPFQVKRSKPVGIPFATLNHFASASTAPWVQTSCVHFCKICHVWQTAMYMSTPMPDFPIRLPPQDTTRPPSIRARQWAGLPKTDWLTSLAAAAAQPPITFVPSLRRSAHTPRDRSQIYPKDNALAV